MSSTLRFIYLVGIDGSGKSTLARKLQQELTDRRIRSRVVWLRMNYYLARPILLYCRLAGLTLRPIVNGQKISLHEFQHAPVVATLVQYLHWLDTILAFFFKAYLPMHLQGETVICDRFVYDILIDYIIESGNADLQNRLIRRLLLKLLPKDARVFLIKTDRNVIVKRRPDVLETDPYFDARYAEYASLDQRYAFIVIDNNQTLEQAKNAIFTALDK